MARWDLVIDVSDLWHTHEDSTTYDFTQQLVKRLKDERLRVLSVIGQGATDALDQVLDSFETEIFHDSDYDDFDLVLEALYDWADTYRVWIETHKVLTDTTPSNKTGVR